MIFMTLVCSIWISGVFTSKILMFSNGFSSNKFLMGLTYKKAWTLLQKKDFSILR
ncbi:hypothetical protein C0J52_12174 [Blattella germanica]|nr:hypothetical protein C0J52_12174 [Blattella germanica]